MRALLTGICLLALIGGLCGGDAAASERGQAHHHPKTAAVATFAPGVATGALGLDLLRAGGPGNVVISPDSVEASLAMAGIGSVGQTGTEIARTLHLKSPAAFSEVGDLQGAIAAAQASAAAGDPEAPILDIADGLFVQSGLPIEPDFLGAVGSHFGATPESLDFAGDPTRSLETINAWVAERTGGAIPRILSSLPEGMALALVNAVYLHANWRFPFKRSDTMPAPFHSSSGVESAEFLNQTKSLRYGAGKGYRAVALPYRSSKLSLMVVLPVGQRLGSLLHRLDGRALSRIARGLSSRTVELSMPRFRMHNETELSEELRKLGMPIAFGEAADFSGITTAAPMRIGFVKHAADFALDEKGTTASAATVTGFQLTSAEVPPLNPVTFNADRPFLFFLRDESTGAVLFAGRLTDPDAATAER